ncbi:hypothetical protein C8R44DRAFT_753773 [Mycena epipterygia]|nr:hypothetical protein C8R44DRAFT_753773 [Mycena epipterygia]
MVWNEKFLDLAFRGKFRIINYPVVLENIGQVIGAEQFNTKAPSVKEYNSFMPALERAAKKGTDDDPEGEPVIRIVPWEPAERDQQLEDQDEVPLVVSTDGRALRLVRHSPLYGAAVADAAKRRAQRRADRRKAEGTAPPHRSRPPPPGPAQQENAIAGPSSSRPRHDGTTGRESALAQRLQLSPAVDTPIERPVKRRRRDDDGRDNQVEQTHAGQRKRKRSPDSPGGGDAAQEPPLIAMRFGVNNQRSMIFYAKRFQPTSRARLGDRYTFYFDTVEDKWRQIPDGMEPVLASQDDEARALRAKELFGLVN